MNKEQQRDNELADYTDALLKGQELQPTSPEEAEMVRLLARAMGPRPVPEGLRRDLKNRIASEFPRRRSAGWNPLRFFGRPSQRRLWAAAAAVAIVAIAAMILLPTDPSQTTGTAIGELGLVPILVALVLLAGVIILVRRISR
jgi:ferric-dicitrate binding protein FerR (iron transport regulator)